MNARRSRPSGPGARRTAVARPAAAMLFAAALLLPAEALAHKCDRTDNDRREASRVIADLTGEIDAMERAIIEALRLQTGQLSGYIAQSAKAVTGALDSQTKLQAQTAREVAETGAMMAHRPSRSACEAVTGLRGLAATGAAAKGAHGRAAATETGRIMGDRAVVDRPGAAAGNAARFESVTREYCNAGRAGEDPELSGIVAYGLMNASFKLIDLLPSAVLDWIGGRAGAGDDGGERTGGTAVAGFSRLSAVRVGARARRGGAGS